MLGRGSYPLSLLRLGELSGEEGRGSLIRAARTQAFRDRALIARSGDVRAPVVFWEDFDLLASDPELLRYALRRASGPSNQAHTIADLAGHLTSSRDGVLQNAFRESVTERLEANDLPGGVGSLTVLNKTRLFLLDDVGAAPHVTWTEKSAAAAPAGVNGRGAPAKPEASSGGEEPQPRKADFEDEFWRTFHRLDVEGGRRNFVSLLAMRNEMDGYDRKTFDAWIREMRNHTQISLAATHGGRRLSPEEREAGIREAGRLLVYVSKR